MATILDWQHLERKINNCESANALTNRSEAFSRVALHCIFRLDDHESSEHMTDGGNDFGVDSVFIDRRSTPIEIHILQFKCHQKFKSQDRSFPEGALPKLLTFFTCLMSRDEGLEQSSNERLREKVRQIYEIIEDETPIFFVHLCSNGTGLNDKQESEFCARLNEFGNINVREHTLHTLVSQLVENKRPTFSKKIHASGKEIFERTDGNIRGVVATISGGEFFKLVQHPQYTDRINEGIFHDNVRVFLGFSNSINEKIFQSAKSDTNYQFWYLNNGITIVCDHFEYQPGLTSPTITIENYQIVNGRQTSNAIFEAHSREGEKVDNLSILVRIYETRDTLITRVIAEATNSQSRINARNLRSTDPIQRQLADFFKDRGFVYQRVPGEFDGTPNHEKVDSFKLGQVCLSFFGDNPDRARTNSDEIFDRFYEDIFNKNMNFEESLGAYKIYMEIEKKIDEVDIESRNNGHVEHPYYFITYARFFILYTIKLLAIKHSKVIDAISLESYVQEALDIISSILKGSKSSLYEIFRNKRTKERIFLRVNGGNKDLFEYANIVLP